MTRKAQGARAARRRACSGAIGLAVLFGVVATRGLSQSATAGTAIRSPRLTLTIDSGAVTVGDHILARLVAYLGPGATLVDGVPHEREPLADGLRVLSVSPPRWLAPGKQAVDLTIVAFRPGPTRLPPYAVTYRTSPGAAVDTLVSHDTPLTITPVVPLGVGTLRDIKGIDDTAVSLAAVAGVALILVAAAALGFAFAVRSRRRRIRAAQSPLLTTVTPPPAGPYADALAELTALAAGDLAAAAESATHYAHVVDVLRRYLRDGHGVAVRARTTPELLDALPSPLTTPPLDAAARTLLRRADMVKFARLRPRPPGAVVFVTHARMLLTDWEAAAPTGHDSAAGTPSPSAAASINGASDATR